MSETTELLEFAKRVVSETANEFISGDRGRLSDVSRIELGGREIKLVADSFLETSLLGRLKSTGLTILSEETGLILQGDVSSPRWIVDPLDGSINFKRRIGPSAISVALWQQNTPLFGVLFNLSDRELAWGGKGIGAWINGQSIRVSSQATIGQAILCAGFPARLRPDDTLRISQYFQQIAKFAKVRMIGSAACSLLMVARGAVDAYYEDQIMLWDVAGGLAIVEGAGGSIAIRDPNELPCRVFASNPQLHREFL